MGGTDSAGSEKVCFIRRLFTKEFRDQFHFPSTKQNKLCSRYAAGMEDSTGRYGGSIRFPLAFRFIF